MDILESLTAGGPNAFMSTWVDYMQGMPQHGGPAWGRQDSFTARGPSRRYSDSYADVVLSPWDRAAPDNEYYSRCTE